MTEAICKICNKNTSGDEIHTCRGCEKDYKSLQESIDCSKSHGLDERHSVVVLCDQCSASIKWVLSTFAKGFGYRKVEEDE